MYVMYHVQSNTEAIPHIHWFAYRYELLSLASPERSSQSRSRTLESIEFAAKDDAKLHSVFAHTRRVTGKTSLTVDTAIDADAKYGYFGGRPAPEHKNSTTGTPAFGR